MTQDKIADDPVSGYSDLKAAIQVSSQQGMSGHAKLKYDDGKHVNASCPTTSTSITSIKV